MSNMACQSMSGELSIVALGLCLVKPFALERGINVKWDLPLGVKTCGSFWKGAHMA